MNLQPLDYFEAIYACGLKLLHRNYAGPLLQVARHNDGTEVLVYPDINGVVSLDSPIELLSGETAIGYLGEFLCVGNYTPDPVLENTVVTAGAVTVFDQSTNFNNLTNTDTATQPLLCENGGVFFTDWGLGLSFASGRYYETNAIEQSFTLHMRMQFLNTVGSRYLFRQTGDALYAKVTDTYLDEAVGTDSTVVFLNENYFRDYTTNNIQLPIEEAALITLEVSVSDNVLTSPPVYRIEGADLFHSLVMYSGVDEHVRRHSTNKILAEDVPALSEKLNRFNPQSYYNLVAGAKAMFGTFSFAGVLGPQNTRLMRLKREVGFTVSYIDLLVDNTGYITLDSPVENPSDSSTASVLGEWVAHPDYNNADGIVATDALIDRLYSQINDANYAYSAAAFAEPKLYDSINERLVSAGLNGVVGLEFYVPGDGVPEKGLTLNEPIYAKTVVVVYANKTANYEMNTLVATGYGGQIYSKFSGAQVGVPQLGEHGVTMYDQTNFSFTDDGFDIDVHVVSLYEDNQKLIVDTTEYPVNYDSIPDGIEGTEFEDMARWEFIGSSSANGSFPHKGRICAVIYYDDDKYDQREFIHNYMNTLFGIQNLPISDSTLVEPEIQSTLLTDYPGAAAAYSLRKVNPEYDGPCIRVRRASDNVEIDVRFNSLYEVNQSALNVFCNGTDGFVTKWYDQSGNGVHATQTTSSGQPKVYDASTGLVTEGGKPTIDWVGSKFMSFDPISLTAHSLFAVAKLGAAFLTNDSWNNNIGFLDGTGLFFSNGGARSKFSGASTSAFTLVSFHRDGTTSVDAYQNGGQLTITEDNVSTETAIYSTFAKNSTRYYGAKMPELIIYGSDQSVNRKNIESEINEHYGIYDTGLLAEYPDAAASYSLRQLITGYTGPAVRVRRASDNTELNVYFDSTGFIDIAAIAAHCAGSDGFVSVWFDQSGGENDAVQSTTSAQPKIYDASTGYLGQIGDGTLTHALNIPNAPTTAAPISLAMVAIHASGTNSNMWNANEQGTNTNYLYARSDSNNTFDAAIYGGAFVRSRAAVSAGEFLGFAEFLVDGSNVTAQAYVNGTGATAVSTTPPSGIDVNDISTFQRASTANYGMQLKELVVWNTNQSSNRTGIETNINDEYAIYGQSPTGFLANYPGAAAAYSLRQLVSTAKYAVAVRRDSDDAVLPIGFVDGELDTTTLAAFCSGANGFVAVWFDQSGEGNHATQTTTANQPKIYDASTGVELDGTKPTAEMSSTAFIRHSLTSNLTGDMFWVGVFSVNRATVNLQISTDPEIRMFDNGGIATVEPTYSVVDVTYEDGRQLATMQVKSTGSTFTINGNVSTEYAPTSVNMAGFEMGSSGISHKDVRFQEYIIYPSDQSANRAGIETNINDHYTVYAPQLLLNEYDGAAAAYSLRQLDNTYTGSAVRVRRESDNAEQDISFVNNELDTTALDAFCTGTNCYVTTWYDQSGNARNMEQTTTAAQGKIYDASTGVINEGGLPSVLFTSYQVIYHSLSSNLTGDMFFAGVFSKYGTTFRQDISNDPWIRYNNDATIITNEGAFKSTGLTYLSGRHLATFQVKSTGATYSENGVVSSEYAGGTSVNMGRFQMNADNATYGGGTNQGTTYWQEFVIYNSDQSANRAGIETNINDHYTIYTP